MGKLYYVGINCTVSAYIYNDINDCIKGQSKVKRLRSF